MLNLIEQQRIAAEAEASGEINLMADLGVTAAVQVESANSGRQKVESDNKCGNPNSPGVSPILMLDGNPKPPEMNGLLRFT